MPSRIEDYAVIGNCETLALVGRDGSIDWLGLPRFDSSACFSALLGDAKHGRWLIAPEESDVRISRRYLGDTLILETVFRTEHGAVSLTDFMSRRDGASDLIRIVRGLQGEVAMRMELVVRFDYGSVVPWVSKQEDGRHSVHRGSRPAPARYAGRDARRRFPHARRFHDRGWAGSKLRSELVAVLPPAPAPLPAAQTLEQVESSWSGWAARCNPGEHRSDAVLRSLLTLKALTHWETGGIVAAGTTSLPEKSGGSRNWDYRYCWLRDATFTLLALIGAGFLDEAKAWHQWLLRAVAGSPDDVQTMYGVAGERRLDEYEIPWLPGYEGASPVRVGNAAVEQLQLDVYGEVLDAFYVARRAGLVTGAETWDLECALLSHLEKIWRDPDEGIWEVRGGAQHFTHSKVMAWVAFDRAVRSIEEFELERSARALALHPIGDP